MKIRFPVAVSGTAWSVSGWSNSSGRQSKRVYEDSLVTAVREGVMDAVGSDPNVTVVHWVEVEVPVPESQTVQGEVVP